MKCLDKPLFSIIKYKPEYPINISNASDNEQNKQTIMTYLPISP